VQRGVRGRHPEGLEPPSFQSPPFFSSRRCFPECRAAPRGLCCVMMMCLMFPIRRVCVCVCRDLMYDRKLGRTLKKKNHQIRRKKTFKNVFLFMDLSCRFAIGGSEFCRTLYILNCLREQHVGKQSLKKEKLESLKRKNGLLPNKVKWFSVGLPLDACTERQSDRKCVCLCVCVKMHLTDTRRLDKKTTLCAATETFTLSLNKVSSTYGTFVCLFIAVCLFWHLEGNVW